MGRAPKEVVVGRKALATEVHQRDLETTHETAKRVGRPAAELLRELPLLANGFRQGWVALGRPHPLAIGATPLEENLAR